MLVRLNDCDAQRRSTKLIAPTTRLKILHASQPPGTISVQYLIVAVKMKTCQLTKLMVKSLRKLNPKMLRQTMIPKLPKKLKSKLNDVCEVWTLILSPFEFITKNQN
jgi:hypothetical protein